MAKLSDLKKVEMLEAAVLSGDIEQVKSILDQQKPIEFTAKAIGLACRFIGAEMVEALLDGGASLNFALTPNLKRKYDCKISINNYDDMKIDFTWYLFPVFKVEGYDKEVISDKERRKVLKVLFEKNACDFSEVLYYSILYDDTAIREELTNLGVSELSEYRTDIVAGRVPINRMDSYGRYDKREFQELISMADDNTLLSMLKGFLECMKVDKIMFFPSDYYAPDYSSFPSKNVFVSRFCSTTLFDFFVQNTNMVEKAKKWDMLFALVEQNNADGMQYALKEKWISKPKDISLLLSHAQKKKNINPELIGSILEIQNQTGKIEKKTSKDNSLYLEEKPLSASEIKKLWGTKKLEDGTFMITSYKGEATEVIIPNAIGKVEVTAIDAATFSVNAPRITEIQKKVRANITSVEFPGSIRVIPKRMFYGGFSSQAFKSLKRVILNEGTLKISEAAFEGCTEIEEFTIPASVQVIGNSAFRGCRKLKKIILPKDIDTLPYGIFSSTGIETFIIPETVKTFGTSIFSECKSLSSVVLPETMQEIPDSMFAGCQSLNSVTIPANISRIGSRAFSGCSFEEIDIPKAVKRIDILAFSDCKKLRTIEVPETIELGERVFSGCSLLADKDGQIVVNGTLFGLIDPNSSYRLSEEMALKPLMIKKEIQSVAVDRESLPEIVYRETSEEGKTLFVADLSVGDEVFFGRFPDEEDYIMKPLKWRVLSIEDGKALLITDQEIISQRRELTQRDVWAKSPVRELLNKGFYETAFSEEEKKQIITSHIVTPKNKEQRVDGGPDTKDKVFLLCVEEVEKYMPTEDSRKTTATEYAHRQHPTKRDWGFWQLRTPGKDGWGSLAVSESSGTYCASTGNHVGYSYIRPAIWIK